MFKNPAGKKDKNVCIIAGAILAILGALITYAYFPVNLFFSLPTVNETEIEKRRDIPKGKLPGSGIERLASAGELENISSIDYVSAEVSKLIPIDAYLLKDSDDSKSYRVGKRNHKGASSFTRSSFFLMGRYNQFFAAELPDHSYIIVLADPDFVKPPSNGQTLTLPIGAAGRYQSSNIDQALSSYRKKYHITTDYILDTSNTTLYRNMKTGLILLRGGAGAVVFILIAVLTVIFSEKWSKRRKEDADTPVLEP